LLAKFTVVKFEDKFDGKPPLSLFKLKSLKKSQKPC
jgi:hypothetical protein